MTLSPIYCTFIDNFEKIYNHWVIQWHMGEGPIFDALGDVLPLVVVGRRYNDPTPDLPLGEGICLMEDPSNPVNAEAVAVYRTTENGLEKIGYLQNSRLLKAKKWMALARSSKVSCVNSPKAVYFFEGRNLF